METVGDGPQKAIEKASQKGRLLQSGIEKLKDCHFGYLTYIKEQAQENLLPAVFLLNQIVNFKRKIPTRSEDVVRHYIVLRHLSTKAYGHIRKKMLLKLPSRNTLEHFIGGSSGEIGFNDMIKATLKTELDKPETPQSRVCSLIVD